ncbi:MAG: hypothetical protein ACI85Q_000771 [Salibacteraceae bacterium]|jgi:hypothetical protein
MKKLFNYSILLLLFLVLSCGTQTIDIDSLDFNKNMVKNNNELIYKGTPFTGTIVRYKEGKLDFEAEYKEGVQISYNGAKY